MSNSVYATLTRQSGLMQEMQVVANNIANTATTGYRAEGVVFSEYVKATGPGAPSISMAVAGAHNTSTAQGGLTQTGGSFDLAIEGDGFFQVETPAGPRLSRAGAFIATPEGTLVTPEGYPLLDEGSAPVFVPTDAGPVGISADGTISADGQPIGQIGLVTPEDPLSLRREDGVRFATDSPLLPVENGRLLQGFLEASNVDPIGQIARMIEIQRNYEMGQAFLDREDQRLRSINALIGR